jgi:hypothetical protein
MATNYGALWDRRLRDEFGGNRGRLYRALVDEISNAPLDSPDSAYGYGAADIGEYFTQPRLEQARRQFDQSLDRGYRNALRGMGSRLAQQQRRLGSPTTGASTRMEGSIGRPEGLAASSLRAQKQMEHEDALLNNPNLYSDISNFEQAITGEDAKHQGRAANVTAGLDTAAEIMASIPGFNIAAAPVIGALKGGSAGAKLVAGEAGRLSAQRAAKFNPGLWQARRRKVSDPGAGMGLNYQPFGSNEGALGSFYGRPRRKDEEEDYLFGSYR